MISGQTFLVFGDDWGHPTTTQHLLRQFVPNNRVLWVHLPGLRSLRLTRQDLTRVGQKLLKWTPGFAYRSPSSMVTLYSPFIIPFNANPLVRRWNRHTTITGVRRRLRSHGLRRPIVVASLPNAADVSGAFNESLVVYVCEDEHTEMPGVDPEYVRELEAAFLQRADLILVTSRALCESKSTARTRAALLSQGVDFDHFNSVVAQPTPPPPEFTSIARPRLGFIGAIAPWVDVDLLAAVARRYPHAALVIIGSVRTDVSALRRLPNVVLLGPRPYADAPRYVAQFDVGLIPFRRMRLTQYVNPLKLLEYFAAGLPVVSTPLPDLSAYGDLVHSADSPEGFINRIADALVDTSATRRERRLATARANTWALRAEWVSELLRQALDRRNESAA